MDIKEQKCPTCGSNRVVRHGFNVTRKIGRRQRMKCQKCARTFYEKAEGTE